MHLTYHIKTIGIDDLCTACAFSLLFYWIYINFNFVLTNLFVHAELLLGSDLSLLGSDLSCYERGGDPHLKF